MLCRQLGLVSFLLSTSSVECTTLYRLRGGGRGARSHGRSSTSEPVHIRPTIAAASHNLTGYSAESAVDGDDKTFWLVPGGQRMEMMSCVPSLPPSMSIALAQRHVDWYWC